MYIIFGKSYCQYCQNSRKILKNRKKKYIYVQLEKKKNQKYVDKLIEYGLIPESYMTIPMIIRRMGKDKVKFIGGNEELIKYLKKH
jgi:glutaredoxin